MLRQIDSGPGLMAASTFLCMAAHPGSTVRRAVMRWTGAIRSISITDHWERRDEENAFMEEVHGEVAMDWVRKRNERCIGALGSPLETPLYRQVLSILDSKDKIPHVRKIGDRLYNFWQDEHHQRGIWRRTTFDSFKSPNPSWEVVLDIDQLGKDESESWVYKGHTLLDLTLGEAPTRTLMHLSRGGSDAVVVREFDLMSKRFVPPEEGGFTLSEAKLRVSWLSNDELLVGTDFSGDGSSMTDSGYPRVVKVWKRGTDLASAVQTFEGEKSDVSVSDYLCMHGGHIFEWRCRSLTFYTSKYSVRKGDQNVWYDLSDLQEDAEVSQYLGQMLISLRSDWNVAAGVTYKAGSLLAVDIMDFVRKGLDSSMTVLFEPTDKMSLDSFTSLKSRVVLHLLDNVKSRLTFWQYSEHEGWIYEGGEEQGCIRAAHLSAYDSDTSDLYWLTTSSFIQPSQLCLADAAEASGGIQNALSNPIKSLPAQFDSSELEELQQEAISADGTSIPYFIIKNRNAVCDGKNRTLLYGYGGFEISLLPSYAAVTGAAWLSAGNVYVFANIRGGGEFGPSWHQAALRENRHKAYDDFIAVAEHLISTGVTTSKRLAIQGGSNGGLLMGNMITRRPDLFGAVICQVPLLDMKRYSSLLAGASWMAEYGDPSKADDWEFLKHYSAYHNIDYVNAAQTYPPLLMMTSTRDDRVHPYHARSFVKRLIDVGCKNVFYYENIEGGHGGAADAKQRSYMICLYIMFLNKTLA